MTLVSLFAGVGGFDLGFERAGFKTVGQCEIDPHAASVLTRHWPDVPKHDDVTTLDGMHFGPADVVTFGSPCQDLSVAGKRAGLDGERSGLFLEAVRFIREMLEATNGEYPRWAVWENVPGAFSSNGGADFAAVLESLVGGEVRRPADGWAYAGVAFGPLGSAEWRVLDSQHFGVAQRRRRVFLVYHPGGERAGQVLLEPQGVPGHTAPRVEAREGATRGVEGGAGGSRPAWGFSGEFNAALEVQPTLQHDSPTGGGQKPMVGVPVASALTAREGKGPDSDATTTLIPVPSPDLERPVAFKVRGGKEGGGKGYLGSVDQALTISTVQEQYLAEPLAFHTHTGTGDPSVRNDGTTNSLTSQSSPQAVAFALRGREDGATPEVSGDRTNALRGAGGGSSRDYVAFAENSRAELRLEGGNGQVTGALSTGGGKPGQGTPTIATAYAVRRLTPVECERLQGFPDNWTALGATRTEERRVLNERGRALEERLQREWEESDDPNADEWPPLPEDCYDTVTVTVEEQGLADTHRYRVMGNAVTVSVAEWIARRLKEALS